ncbi:hypothetical protein DID74_00065 [Candidatus Marinamargulisbacteria bacterium SCGC AG-333-B06]|nr:hypothetical protein DID74_00065 [Candidatus Marinamargulisbacteria bacterium SCGC AG-333-B06]
MKKYFLSLVFVKQLVAVSGLAMVGFLIAHLLGNFLIFSGPIALNLYASKLHDLGPILWIMRLGLLAMFLLHFSLVVYLVIVNKKARENSYALPIHKKTRSFFTQTMRYSGLLIFVYIFVHLFDFTFTPHTAENSVIDGMYYGLYGHVYNYFLNIYRSLFYIVTMFAIGFHLVHGVQSVMQTFGFYHVVYTPIIKKISWSIAFLIAFGFSSIPIYINFHYHLGWEIYVSG